MKLITVLFTACVSVFLFAQAQAASTTVDMKAEIAPLVLQYIGNDSSLDNLAATRYPEFKVTCGPEWASCKSRIESLSGARKSGVPAFHDLLLAPASGSISIDPRYRKTGKILVTWNVRIIGKDPAASIAISPGLCQYFVGTVQQHFKGGNVYTRLSVKTPGSDWKVLGSSIGMTIPDGRIETVNINNPVPQPPRPITFGGPRSRSKDPTHTGSYLITGKDFANGELPENLQLKVEWQNDISLDIYSEVTMRSIVATITRE